MSLRVWDIENGVQVLAIEEALGNKDNCTVHDFFLCCADQYIVVISSVTVNKKKGDVMTIFNTKWVLIQTF